MKTYKRSFEVVAPMEAVSRFHGDTRALRILNPPGLWVQFHKVEPISEGSIADFTLWLGPLPIRWMATHSDVGPDGFSDTQTRGPFDYWHHRHQFTEISEGRTLVSDEIQAQPGKHFFWGLVSWGMWFSLPLLFAYRAWRTRNTVESSEMLA
jgi:ligand-binding SRPBCC domain-containing protein